MMTPYLKLKVRHGSHFVFKTVPKLLSGKLSWPYIFHANLMNIPGIFYVLVHLNNF